MSGHQTLIMPIWALIIRASKNGYKNIGRYIPGYTVSRKVSGKQVKKYPDIQFQRNFLKFLKVSQKS